MMVVVVLMVIIVMIIKTLPLQLINHCYLLEDQLVLPIPVPLHLIPIKILYPTPTTTTTTTTTTDHTTVLDDISHLRVLVAEDNLVNQEVISRMLKQEGITNLTMACNGAKAIDFVKESIENNENFDLIFMDVQMPEVDGLKATKMIRKNLQYNKPIIALTAFADESNVKECLNSGMSGFITKPISKTNIKKVLVEFLSNEVVTS